MDKLGANVSTGSTIPKVWSSRSNATKKLGRNTRNKSKD